jgi:hypothetical protein
MTVAGPLNAVVKRVTMHVKRTDDLSRIDPGWDGIPTLILEGNVPEFTTVTLDHLIDGTSDLSVVGIPDPGGWPSNWHLDAPTPPDPENYEVMIELISDTPPSGAAIDTWLNASSAYQWVWDMNGLNGLLGVIDWHYRRIGQPSSQSTRRVSITLTRGDPI